MRKRNLNLIEKISGKMYLIILMAAIPIIASADVKWKLINTMSTSSGLPSDEVVSLRFDSKGNLWTSTNLSFAKYANGEWYVYGENDGLPWNEARMGKIFIDSKENVWICSDENGLVKIDANEKIEVYNTENGLMSDLVFDIAEDNEGGYYISNSDNFGNAMSHVDKYGNWEHYDFSILGGNPFDYILSLYYDNSDNTLYMGTLFAGIMTLKDGEFTPLSEDYQYPISEIESNGNGVIYAATDYGIMVIDKNNNNNISVLTMENGLPDNFITTITFDNKGRLWAGTDGYGVVMIDGDNVETYSTYDGLTSNDIYTIAFDENNNAWLGTRIGGICYQEDINTWKHIGSTGLVGNDVNTLLFDGDVTWYATSSGISRNEGELWKNYMFMNDEGTGLASNYVSNILKDNRGGKNTIYASGNGGIAKYNSMFDEWEYYKYEAEDKEGNKIYPKLKLFQMSNGDMWTTTFGQNLGIAKFDDATGELTYYNDKNVDVISKNSNSFFEAVEAPDGSIWFGSVEGALILKDGVFTMESFETKLEYEDPETGDISYGYDNNVRKIHFADDGKIWIGKISGIIIYDPATGEKIQELGDKNDPVAIVTDFWFDGEGNTFISTLLSGIYMRTKNGNYYHLGKEYGLDLDMMTYSMKEKDGQLYICCINGVMITSDHKNIINDILAKENPTGIDSANSNKVVKGIYDPSGIRRNTLTKGLNIVVNEDGSVKKVMVK